MSKFKLSERSIDRLKGVDNRLIEIVELAIQRTPIDFGIAWMGGFRTEQQQNDLFKKEPKVTGKDGYINKSKHQLGLAVDLMPYVGNKAVMEPFLYHILIGVMFSCANELGYKLRSGANWDMDNEFITDQKFIDLPHFEIV